MYYSTQPVIREQFITGLRELAAYLDSHPAMPVWTPTGFVDTIRSGTMVYEERIGRGTGSQEVHPGI
jgi:hypothetical protein